MRLYLLIASLLASCGLYAQSKSEPKNIAIFENIRSCKSVVFDYITGLPINADWINQAPLPTGSQFRSASKTFGTWYELEVGSDGKASVSEINKSKIIKTSWTTDCKVKTEKSDGFDFSKIQPEAGPYIDDAGIQKILEENDSGIIYIWSPGMVYSADYHNQYAAVAKQLKLKFVPVVDPKASSKSLSKAEKTFKIPSGSKRLNSVELYMRGTTVHYPSAILFKNKKLIDPIIVGVFPKAELILEIQKFTKGNAK